MSVARKIISNTFSQVAGKAIVAVLSVVVVKILANYLGKSGYGEYATIYEFLAFFGVIADLGLFTIAVREMSKMPEKKAEIFGNTLTLRTLLTTFAMLLGALAAFLIPKYSGTFMPKGIAIAAIATWFVILSGTVSTILQVVLRMEFHAIALVIGKIFTVFIILIITKIWHPVVTEKAFYELIWAGVVGSGVTFLITLLVVKKFVKIKFLFDKDLSKKLIEQALPFGIALILNTIYFRLDIIIFSLILPRSIDGVCTYKFCADTEAGSYAVAVRMLEVLIIIPLFFMNSVLPVLSQHIQNKSKRLREILVHSYHFLFATGIAGAIGAFVIARPIAKLISSEEFLSNSQEGIYGSDTALRILMIAMFFTFLTTFFGFALIALGHQKKLLWINLIAVLFNLFSNLYVIPRFGLAGAATTSVISEFLILIMVFYALKKTTKEFKPEYATSLKFLLSAIIMGIFTYLFYNFLADKIGEVLSLVIVIFSSVILYSTLLFLTKAVSKEMLNVLKKSTK